jgi:hypothetical protein
METTNESLKNIAKAAHLLKYYLTGEELGDRELLVDALLLIEEAIEKLSKSTNI